MEDFYDVLAEVRNERYFDELVERKKGASLGEHIYTKFCCWCNAFRTMADQTNAKVFAEFLKEEGIELTPLQRKHISEKYFGYEYTFNYETNEWEIKKKKGA